MRITTSIGLYGAKKIPHPHNVVTKGMKIWVLFRNLCKRTSLGFTKAK